MVLLSLLLIVRVPLWSCADTLSSTPRAEFKILNSPPDTAAMLHSYSQAPRVPCVVHGVCNVFMVGPRGGMKSAAVQAGFMVANLFQAVEKEVNRLWLNQTVWHLSCESGQQLHMHESLALCSTHFSNPLHALQASVCSIHVALCVVEGPCPRCFLVEV